jgi:hypothetical protein
VCGNGLDDDCDGQVDEGLAGCCGSGTTRPCGVAQGACAVGSTLCAADGTWGACLGAGGDAVTLPGQVAESCNGLDDDCDGRVDEPGALDCTDRWFDGDGDGFGVGAPLCLCAASGPYSALQGGDCDGTSASAAPGGSEVCDGYDNDCNGVVDDLPYSLGACDGSDADYCTDGANACRAGVFICVEDATGKVELCGNDFDDDCDGQVDEACPP